MIPQAVKVKGKHSENRPAPAPAASAAEQEVKAAVVRVAHFEDRLVPHPANAGECAEATAQFNQLKQIQSDLKSRKERITKPLNEALKQVRALFAPVEARLTDAITQLKLGLEDYHAHVREKLAAKQERLAARVEAGDLSEAGASRLLVKQADKLGAAVTPTRTIREVVVFDKGKVPDLYWVLDMVKLRKDALEGLPIPGVRVEEKDIVVKG